MTVGFGALECNPLTSPLVTLDKSLSVHEPQPPRCLVEVCFEDPLTRVWGESRACTAAG